MRIPLEIEEMLLDNPNGSGYIPKENLTEKELSELKEINNKYKKMYGTNLISF